MPARVSSRRPTLGALLLGGLGAALLRHGPSFAGSPFRPGREQGRVALRAKATLEQKLRTWIPKAEEAGLDAAKMIPELQGTFVQGLPGPLTDAEYVEVANKVAQELLGTSIGAVSAAPAAAAPAAAAPAAAAPPAVASGGDHSALEQKLRAWIPKAKEQGLNPVKLLPELKGVFTAGLALSDADFMEVANKVLGVGMAAAPAPAAAAPAAAAPAAAASPDKDALEQKLRQWIPNAAANGLNPAKMLPELKSVMTQGMSVTDADYSEVVAKLLQEL